MRLLRSALLPVVAVLAASLASGCATPFLKRAPGVPDPKPQNAMVSGFLVEFQDTNAAEDKGLVGAMVDAAQNAGLEEFGKKATELLASKLAQQGYTVVYDQARSKNLDAIQLSSSATMSALTGTWRHPDSSYWTPERVDGLFSNPKDVVAKLKSEAGGKEYFAFCGVTIWDTGMFLKEPTIKVTVAVYDESARKVLDMRGFGQGGSTLFFSDRSPQNLMTALTNGFDSLEKAQEEALP